MSTRGTPGGYGRGSGTPGGYGGRGGSSYFDALMQGDGEPPVAKRGQIFTQAQHGNPAFHPVKLGSKGSVSTTIVCIFVRHFQPLAQAEDSIILLQGD